MSAAEKSIRKNLTEVFELPSDAVAYLCDVFAAIQFFDDVADGDAVTPGEVSRALWVTMVAIPQNPFFVRNSYQLTSSHAMQILKWHAANDVESSGCADAKSYMWRAGYYDLVLLVVYICFGSDKASEIADDVLGLYGELFEDYMGEFQNA